MEEKKEILCEKRGYHYCPKNRDRERGYRKCKDCGYVMGLTSFYEQSPYFYINK
jgi:hypothetical protein